MKIVGGIRVHLINPWTVHYDMLPIILQAHMIIKQMRLLQDPLKLKS